MKITHNLIQGSPEWHQFRLEHDGASEAAAMLGLSPKVKRTELLRMKKTGLAKEFSDWVQRNVLDYGHEVEALARPLVEAIIGEELYPVTCSNGRQSASCDGLTMDDRIAFEHKQWNEAMAAHITATGTVPPEHMPQCQQVLKVTGAEKLIFVISDGTAEKMLYVWVLPDAEWFQRIDAGWAQFHADLEAFVPAEVVAPVTAAPMESLPAVSVRMNGDLAVASNLPEFATALTAFIARIPVKPSTDQEFADAESACKALKKAEDALESAETHALAQMSDVEEMRRMVADLRNLARTTRLAREKDVAARKEQIRIELVQAGAKALADHVAALNVRLGKPYMPPVTADFAGAIKGKRTIDSLRDAVDTTLAHAKMAASATADRIQINLNTLRDLASDHKFLFADAAQIVLKATDDLETLVKARVAEHDRQEAAKAEAQREKIRQEELARIEREQAEAARVARVKAEAEDQAAEAAAREKNASRRLDEDAMLAAQTPAPAQNPLAQVATENVALHATAPTLAIVQQIPASTLQQPAANADTEQPQIKLGDINARIAPLSISADGLAQLGFTALPVKGAARMYLQSDLPKMLQAMMARLGDERRLLAA